MTSRYNDKQSETDEIKATSTAEKVVLLFVVHLILAVSHTILTHTILLTSAIISPAWAEVGTVMASSRILFCCLLKKPKFVRRR